MKREIFAAILLLPLVAIAQTKEERKLMKEIAAKAGVLSIGKCELNDGTKGWIMPNREPINDLPIYRCTAEAELDPVFATFTQIPDGSVKKEAVEFCTFADYHVKCVTVPLDRPVRRTADLAKFGVNERQFEPIVCETTSVGTIPLSMCSKARVKQEPGGVDKLAGKK